MKKAVLTIRGRKVGYDYKPLVIAEIGINHGGSLEEAKKIVDAALEAGAEVIKHQTHIVEDEMSNLAKTTIPGNANKSIYEIMDECALNEAEEKALMEYVENKGGIFISTPFSRAAANRLESFGVPAYKIGSGECNNYPLIKHIANFGKPIILSTGMNDLDTVRGAVNILEKYNVDYALLHTTNLYPTDPKLVRLGAMTDLQNEFPNAVIGLSDHTTSNHACLGAVALGASILERHFTDSLKREGPDIVCSMDPRALKNLITGANLLQQMRGGNKKVLLEEEQVTRDFAYATVVSIKDIKAGDAFTKQNIWVKRPGVGEIPAIDFEQILGKTATEDIAVDQHLKKSQVK
ncbi:N-acetylneuraminate synthase family protein [Phaeodactylibacter sp.]|uniref:N-acetylneuraminate synthase family protein n=1 Tax=Phaeodactylibacter sp. TaxID=1940289 RepID=UPI0025DD42CB|nr:N-acetylneuraminate synthase family protein [Phaeodactylibacter sp.]MCI5055369.1 N-acetylneuraminate synthase family protein [Flavobacteriales bacterium]MCI5090785.1 N-acetylneuraminate synthase family protein [Phaeodactylibacter sp.]